jgi:hypothetical protein
MTSQDFLKNLQSIRQLDAVPASPELARRWLAAARTRLNDARAENVSAVGRFDSAYNALRFAADIGLLLHGYRTGSREGHHQIALQSLVHTFEVDAGTVQAIAAISYRSNRYTATLASRLGHRRTTSPSCRPKLSVTVSRFLRASTPKSA